VPWPEPDPLIAAAIAAKYRGKRPRPLAVLIRDRLGEWLGDEDFAAAFGIRGRPGWSPSRLALVTVLQRAENLTDRQAAEAVRTRIDWQYLLGLRFDDPGFDHTVLAGFRGRVAGAGLEQVVLDALLARLVSEGLVKAGGKQRTDSTRVVAAVAALTRLQLAGESVRAALEALVAAHPAWLEQRVCVSDFARRYGTPMTSWRPRFPRRSRMSWRSPTPATATRCWRRSTTARRRPGCGSSRRSACCAGCCCRTTPAPSPRTGGR
jgi:transposase